MDLLLYNQSGCRPRNTGTVSFTIPIGESLEKTMVAAVAGKKIIPIWICLTINTMSIGSDMKYDLKSGSTTLISASTQTTSSWPLFSNFGCDLITSVEVGGALKVKCYGANTEIYKVALGYYII